MGSKERIRLFHHTCPIYTLFERFVCVFVVLDALSLCTISQREDPLALFLISSQRLAPSENDDQGSL